MCEVQSEVYHLIKVAQKPNKGQEDHCKPRDDRITGDSQHQRRRSSSKMLVLRIYLDHPVALVPLELVLTGIVVVLIGE